MSKGSDRVGFHSMASEQDERQDKNKLDRGYGQCKGPGAGMGLVCFPDSLSSASREETQMGGKWQIHEQAGMRASFLSMVQGLFVTI